jgi:hypothetical protein
MPAGLPAWFLDDGQPASAGRVSKIEKLIARRLRFSD